MKKYYRIIFRYINLLKQTLSFVLRAIRLRYLLTPIDSESPFQGILKDSGVYGSTVSNQTLNDLKNVYETNKQVDNQNEDYSIIYKVHLNNSYKDCIREIFNILHPIVREYLGDNSYLDGIHLGKIKPKYNSLSGKWHVDNVGNRLKCFICIKGDGSLPTFVIPSDQRIPSFKKWINDTFLQSLRWAGFNSINQFNDSFECKHKDGTLFIFDSLLLHRGGYEKSEKERILLHLEFSNIKKHSLTKKIFDYNSFSFDRDLLNIESFSSLINTNRILRDKTSGVCKYVPLAVQGIK